MSFQKKICFLKAQDAVLYRTKKNLRTFDISNAPGTFQKPPGTLFFGSQPRQSEPILRKIWASVFVLLKTMTYLHRGIFLITAYLIYQIGVQVKVLIY